MTTSISYRIFPLNESVITVDFGNIIDYPLNQKVISLFNYLKDHPIEHIIEVVPAYSSLTVYYDTVAIIKENPSRLAYDVIREQLESLVNNHSVIYTRAVRVVRIPVCYAGADLDFIAKKIDLQLEEIIAIHSGVDYHVYMLGFLPGFPYLGEVDERIRMPRKEQPTNVVAGSIGIAGSQTGIYPVNSPGGWQIIGRTPLTLFDAAKEEPALLKAGDTVQFYPISRHEFENY